MFSRDLITDLSDTDTGAFQVRHYPSESKHTPLTRILTCPFI